MNARAGITKCICGENSFLYFINKCGRLGENTINVVEVPVYICSECGEQYSSGPDSILFAKRVKEAIEIGVREIHF